MRNFDADRDLVIQRAFQSGVEAILNVGIDLHCSRAAIEMAGRYPSVFAAVGFHPNDAIALDENNFSQLAQLASQPKVVAVGEIGLDFTSNVSPRDIQQNALRRQLELASQLNLPVVVHNGNADKEIMAVLRRWAASNPLANGQLRGVMHCFSGDPSMAHECVKLGFLISIAGNVTYPDHNRLVEVVRHLPLENLLVETDSPFLSPHPHEAERNEPANVRFVAEKIAEVKGVSVEDVGRVTTINAARLFNLSLPEPTA